MSLSSLARRLQDWARRLRRDAVTLWFALRHPQTPWFAKAMAFAVVAYALSPIDLVPDFIPLLGYLDDLLLLPGLIWLSVKLVPPLVLVQCRSRADEWMALTGRRPSVWQGAVLVFAVWLALGLAAWFWLEPGRLTWWG